MVVTRKQVAGFFSNFFWALQNAISAQDSGRAPILQLAMQRGPLSTDTGNSAGTWSKYFIVLDESNSEHIPDGAKTFLDETCIGSSVLSLDELVEGFWRTMPLRSEVISDMNQDAKNLGIKEKHRVLGVHFRGTDMNWHPRHPTPPTQYQMMKVIEQALSEDDFDLMFVATDTPSFIKRLRKELEIPVVNFTGACEGDRYESGTYPLTYSVLRDAWTLSRCQALIHADSNVSSAARLFKGIEYEFRIEIRLGTNPSHLLSSTLHYLWRAAAPKKRQAEKVNLTFYRNEEE